ncbi:MAG: hypothetical protein INR69_08255 [Mucilaginibacter polytrichastri]|nr:hypothetical protein [Mucilaginibacter polytrichastri]
MKNILTLALFVLILSACGRDSGVSPDESFIPDISGGFSSSRSPSTSLFFQPEKTGVNTSAFIGLEQPAGSAFSGTFTNYTISFTFSDGPEKGITYSGKFVKNSNPLKMEVKGTNNVSLTLTRIPN